MKKNILLDKLPQFAKNGLKIRTDFRESIKFELLMQNNKIKEEDKVYCALNLYYYDLDKIRDVKQAVDDILWFYRCGKEENLEEDVSEKSEKNKQIYSYEFDDEYIYSSFLEYYGIDLNSIKYLHWWKFKALFNGLGEKTKIVEIMGYRSMNISKIKDKEMRKHYRKMQQIYALPDMRSEKEKEQDFANSLW